MKILREDRAQFDRHLIERYDVRAPRYTSFPTANHFAEGEFNIAYTNALGRLQPDRRMSLYLHVPFCSTICYYCACNKIVTANHKHAETYLARLIREIHHVAEKIPHRAKVDQIHFGGGTPTFLSHAQFEDLFDALHACFELSSGGARDFSIEIDPRGVSSDRIEQLAALGFNRMSVGVQDFDVEVQKAVNRVQSVKETRVVVEAARAHGFESINFDLIYGLPKQTLLGFDATLDQVLRLDPDRLSIYSYAHLPQLFKTQKQIDVCDLLDPPGKLDLLEHVVNRLTGHGYEHVGMDHFAKPGDSLLRALAQNTLQRSFQGYTTHRDCALLGFGASSISTIDGLYTQNSKTLSGYIDGIDRSGLAVVKGYASTDQDQMIYALMQALMCRFEIDLQWFKQRYRETFTDLIDQRVEALQSLEADDLITFSRTKIRVTQKGRYLIRNICTVFDPYLHDEPTSFSKAI